VTATPATLGVPAAAASPTRRRTPAAGRRTALRVVHDALVVLLAVVVIGVPLWLVLVTSAKTTGEAARPDLSLPTQWAFGDNVRQVLDQGEVLVALGGSLLVTVPAVVLLLVLGSAASWVLARRTGRWNAVLYTIGISSIVLPPAVITTVLTVRSLGLQGTAVGMVGVYTGMFMGTVIFFVTGFVRNLPIELEEAARLDGTTPFQLFTRIVLPMLRPVIATAAILTTLSIWNEVFYTFFVLGGGDTTTLPLNLYKVASAAQYVNNWNLIFAYVVLMSLPMIAVFAVAQRRIISGVTSGAVK
jgi:raffinose/stachyose/melibiose transport system permease protein